MWKIIDDNGTIHSGTQIEMENAFDVMTNPDDHSEEEIENWSTEWSGDIELVEVHNISR